jgi:hypothetical protein
MWCGRFFELASEHFCLGGIVITYYKQMIDTLWLTNKPVPSRTRDNCKRFKTQDAIAHFRIGIGFLFPYLAAMDCVSNVQLCNWLEYSYRYKFKCNAHHSWVCRFRQWTARSVHWHPGEASLSAQCNAHCTDQKAYNSPQNDRLWKRFVYNYNIIFSRKMQ